MSTQIVDLELQAGYRKFMASNFKAGLRLLLDHVPELRQALAIQDLARTPSMPQALLKIVKHLHQHKKLPAGVSLSVNTKAKVVQGYGMINEVIPGETTVLFSFTSGLRVGLQFHSPSSRGQALFCYRLADSPMVVHAEGLFK